MHRLSRLAATLNPLRWIFNPVVDLELRVTGRRGWTYIYRFAYVAMAAFIMLITAASMQSELEFTGAASRLQSLSTIAPRIALVVGWMQFASLVFFAPALTAPTICDEKTKRTLVSLATTPLNPAQIVVGKLLGRMVQLLILALVSLPILLIVRVFGGLEIEAVFAMTAVALSSALLSGSFGIFFALRDKRARTAMVKALLATAIVFALPVIHILYHVWLTGGRGPSPRMLDFWSHVNPPFVMGMTTASVMDPGGLPIASSIRELWVWCSLSMILLAVVVCVVSTARLRAVINEEIGGKVSRRARRKLKKGKASTSPTSSRRARSRILGDAVVLWRESRTGIRLRSFWSTIFLVFLGALFIPLYTAAPMDEEWPHILITVLLLLAQLLIATQITTGAVAGERDAQTWDVLMTTALTPRQILIGKWLGGSAKALIIPALLALHWSIFASIGFVHWVGAVTIPMIALAYALFLTSTGLLLSLRCKKSISASVLNLGFAIAVWLGLPMFVAFVIGFILQGAGDFGEAVATIGALGHPVFLCVNSAVQAAEHSPARVARFGYVAMGDWEIGEMRQLQATTFAIFYAFSSTVALGVAAGVLFWTKSLFLRKSGRVS